MSVWQLVLVQIATFITIILFMRWLLYSHISRALKRLQHLNQQNLEKERVLKEEIARAKKQVESEIKDGRTQAEAMKNQAKEEAEKVRRGILEASRKEANRIISEGEKESQRKHEDLLLQMQDKAVYIAIDIIKYIFTEKNTRVLHNQIIDELIENIAELKEGKIKAHGDHAEIICAYPLEENRTEKLKQALSGKLKRNIILSIKVDPEIVAGLVIKLAGFAVIDGSIKNKFKIISPIIREKARIGIGEKEAV
jgi:F-type H+-transporting ATPase subunit b